MAQGQQKPQPVSDYPNKTIRIVTSDAGGGVDFSARIVAQGISPVLGQNVVVENRPAKLTGEIVAKALPDGYTLLVHGTPLWIEPLMQKTAYDPVKDFIPITMLVTAFNLLVVHPSFPAKSVKELITLAKSKPGELNYAGAGIGSSSHLGAELFKSMAAVDIVHIPLKGSGPAAIAVMNGDVHLTFGNAASVTPHVKTGKLRALAVASPKPTALAPGLPTIAETLPGYQIGSGSGLFIPAKASSTIVNHLNKEVVRLLNQPDVKARFFNAGNDVVANSPQEAAVTIKSEMARLGKVIKDVGIRAE